MTIEDSPAPEGFSGLVGVRRHVLADSVLDDLRRVIVSGQIPAGERLRETELAQQMNVSRGPIREALLRLEQEGLVVLERHRGARVAELSLEEREKIYSVRRALEQLAGQYACTNGTELDFERTEAVLREFSSTVESVRTPADAAEWDIRFHDSVFLAAHNDPLYRAWSVLRSQVHYFLTTRMVLRPDYNETWAPEHRDLLDILRRRDEVAYLKAIRRHVLEGYERIISESDTLSGGAGPEARRRQASLLTFDDEVFGDDAAPLAE